MSYSLSDKVRFCKVGNKTYKAILRCLCDCADETGYCFPSRATIIAEVECDKKIIAPALSFLEKEGWIVVRRNQKGNSNVYQINLDKLKSGTENGSTVVPKTGRPEKGLTRKGDNSSTENGSTVDPKTGHEYINNISITDQYISNTSITCPQSESADSPKPQKNQLPCPQQKLIELYHQQLPTLPMVRSWSSPTRVTTMRTRWREVCKDKGFTTEAEGLSWFEQFFAFCSQSAFLRGEGTPNRETGRPFVPDLEWLLKPNNFAKIIDRRYHHGY